jgi:hypothetical protein
VVGCCAVEWMWVVRAAGRKGRLILRRFRNGTGHRYSRTLLYEVYGHFGRLLRLLMNVAVRAGAGGKGRFILRRNTRLEQRKQRSAREETEERDAGCGQGQRRSSQQRAQQARQLKRGRKEGPEGMTCWSFVSRSLTCGAGNAVLQMQRSLGRIID